MMGRLNPSGGYRGNNLNHMIMLSLIAHFLLLSLLVFPRSLSAPKWTFGPVYSVQLVSMPVDSPRATSDSLSYGEIMGGDNASGQAILKKEAMDSLPSVPVYAVKRNSQPAADMENVLDTIRRKIQSSPAVSSPEKPAATTEQVKPQGASPPSRPSDEEVNTKTQLYYGIIWARIKGLWSLPQGILPKKNIEVVIHARILRDGSVVNVGYERHSGNRYFDESAFRAVKKASPLPAFPEGISEESIEVGIRFHSSEFR